MRLMLMALVCFATLYSSAQNISGSITEMDQEPMNKASVSLLHAKDSSLVVQHAADKSGAYLFNKIDTGFYRVMATNVGYNAAYSPVFHYTGTDLKVDNVVMEKSNTQMAGVVVTTKRPLFEYKAGKTLVNVEASPTNSGLNALEVLEKSPGVSVDNDGNISLKGKQGVTILIDGKPTYMSGQQLTTLLKSIQSSGLDQIEIMTSPPAKYDAAGNSGIINIKTKKGIVKGMNGTANIGYDQGFYPRYNAGANINYRNDKLNIFGGYDGGHWDGKGTLYINRKLYENGTGTFMGTSDQASDRRNFGNYNNVKLGLDYNFTKKDVAGFVINGNFGKWNEEQNSLSNLRLPSGAIDYKLLSAGENSGAFKNLTTNLNYKHTFDSAGREISVDLDQAYYNNKGIADLSTKKLNISNEQQGNEVLLNGDIPSEINIYSAKIDYVHPFKKTLKLETGVKTSFVATDNRISYLRDTSSGWLLDESRTNHFLYKENINAAYATLSKTIKKWEFTAGVRVENTNSKGTQVTRDSSFERSYTNLFPTASIAYSVNDKNQFTASYNRRVTRPDYENLNPFVFFLDSLTFSKGNPYLQPQFTNNIELSYTYNKFLTTTLNYTITNDIITELLKQDGKLTFQTLENFSRMRQSGVAVNANFPVTKWWNLNIYTNLFNNNFSGLYNDGIKNYPLQQNRTSFNGNMTSSITFSKLWVFELSGWYRSRTMDGLLVANPMGVLNTALSRQLFNKRATLKVGVRDVFATQVFSGYARYANVDTDLRNVRDNRRFNISFTYKFGKSNIAPVRNRRSGANDEQNRVKSGGN